jgi:hypothetical protein
MTHANGKPHVPSTLVTPHTVYAAAYIMGSAANPGKLHDLEKETAMAEKYADRMCERDLERKVWER